MIQDIELDEEKFEFEDLSDVHSIANVLKQCKHIPKWYGFKLMRADLRELPEPVFLLPHSERVKYTENRGESLNPPIGCFAMLTARTTHPQQLLWVEEQTEKTATNSSNNIPGDHRTSWQGSESVQPK